MSKRESIVAKIQALLSKTVANGCTEAEAMSALAMARRMMDAHELDEADLATSGEEATIEQCVRSDRDRIRQSLVMAVAEFCDCRGWRGTTTEELIFCGLQSSVTFAHWLLDTLAAFVARELANFLERTRTRHSPRVRRTETNGFVLGCCNRLNVRMHALCEERRPKGRGLVVAINALIARCMAANGIELRSNFSGPRRIENNAFDEGKRAGDAAKFNRPIEDGGGPKPLIAGEW